MGKVIQFPKSEKERRVDALCALLDKPGPREVLETEAHPDSVCVRVGEIEIWLTPDEVDEWAEDLIDSAKDARARGKAKAPR